MTRFEALLLSLARGFETSAPTSDEVTNHEVTGGPFGCKPEDLFPHVNALVALLKDEVPGFDGLNRSELASIVFVLGLSYGAQAVDIHNAEVTP